MSATALPFLPAGRHAAQRVLILGGLTPGTTIIDRGAGQVVEGEAVQVIR